MNAPTKPSRFSTLREFDSAQDARTFRLINGTGGWIFEPEDGGKSILFPPHVAPIAIFFHPITSGRNGRLIGAA